MDQLNWAKGQVGNNTATNAGVQASLTPQIGTDVGANAQGAGLYGNTVGALGQQLNTAQNYGNQAGMDMASANAQASTAGAYNAAHMNNMRQLGSYGVDPSQMKSGALNLNATLQQAGAVGNAGYQAGQQRQLTGMGLVSNALNQNMMGSNVGQGYGAGANATGQNVAGIGNQTLGANSSALTAPSTMLNTGLSGQSTSANIASQQFGNEMTAYKAQQANSNNLMSSVGSFAGMAAGAYFGGPAGAAAGAQVGSSLADGGNIGAIPGRRGFDQATRHYDNGGGVASVPTGSGVTPVMASTGMSDPSRTSPLASNLASGMRAGADLRGGYDQRQAQQANAMLPKTNAMMANDPQMQDLQRGPQNTGDFAPQFGRPDPTDTLRTSVMNSVNSSGNFADGGQTKRQDYGNPGVIPSRGVPPQVGIPGPWLASNGGAAPGMVQHGPSDGTGIDDQVHAKVSVGEYIIPADVVHAKGKEFFDMLLKKYHVPAQQQRQQMGVH